MGCVANKESLDTTGLDMTDAQLDEILKAAPEDWKAQLPQMREHYAQFGGELPDALRGQLDALERRLEEAS
jgi:phosphoenolpyruvate carboxykinase (GTP)